MGKASVSSAGEDVGSQAKLGDAAQSLERSGIHNLSEALSQFRITS